MSSAPTATLSGKKITNIHLETFAEIEEKQEEPPVEKQSAATTKNRNSGTKKEEEKKNRKGWGIGDLFKNAVDKVGEGIDKALKDEQ